MNVKDLINGGADTRQQIKSYARYTSLSYNPGAIVHPVTVWLSFRPRLLSILQLSLCDRQRVLVHHFLSPQPPWPPACS